MVIENCTACGLGEFSTSDRQGCETCTEGQEANAEGCVSCTPGKYSSEGVLCVDCTAGRYAQNNASSECVECSAGKYALNASSTSCKSCAYGRYTSSAGSTVCIDCGYGDYTGVRLAASTCLACPAGNFSNAPRVYLCQRCEPGFITSGARSASCTACSPGYFQSQHGQSSCTACAAGKVSPAYNSSGCAGCAKGKYAGAASSACEDCSAGYYAENKSSSVCVKCSTGVGPTYTSLEGASSCSRCIENYFWDPLGKECKSCPSGAVCEGEGAELRTLTLEPTYYRFSNVSDTVYACLYSKLCVGGNRSGDDSCATGAKGPLCSVCEAGYNLQDGTCKSCDRISEVSLFVYVVLAILVVGTACVFSLKRFKPDVWDTLEKKGHDFMVWAEAQSEILTPRFQIVWTAYQIIAQTQSTVGDVSYPRVFEKLRSWLSLITVFEFSVYIPASCVDEDYNFYTSLVLVTTIPLVLVFFVMVHMAWKVRKVEKGRSRIIACSGHIYAIVVIAYVVLPTASTALLQTFSCKTFIEGDEDYHDKHYYLSVDYSIECGGPKVALEDQAEERRFFLNYASLMLFSPIGGPVGTPLFFYLLLRCTSSAFRNRRDLTRSADSRRAATTNTSRRRASSSFRTTRRSGLTSASTRCGECC